MPEVSPSKYLVQAGWDDVPHLDAVTKRELLDSTLPYLRDARSKGEPSLGAGAIYPVPLTDFVVKPFALPPFWRKVYGMDVGWKRTAVTWLAYDDAVDCMYIYAEHYRAEAEPSVHAAAIRARGDWIPGVVDPAARGRSQKDGESLMQVYRDQHGLKLTAANHAVDAGLFAVYSRLTTGRLKVFSTCQHTLGEWRWYRRNEKGVIVKENDHAMDAVRYVVYSGLAMAKLPPQPAMSTAGIAADQRAGY